jgi:glycosyltransferase involved in cell wall biosynthesis
VEDADAGQRRTGGTPAARAAILGVYLADDGYPNVKFRVRGLLRAGGAEIVELCAPLPEPVSRAGGPGAAGLLWRLSFFGRALLDCARVAARAIRRHPFANVYVPYPAVLVAWLLSWLPGRWRPRALHLDAFISLYDTVVHDRRLVGERSVAARLLFALERRAYAAATTVIVDTQLNADFVAHAFGLPADKVVPLPLAIDEATYAPVPYVPRAGRCRAVFVGTFVPLQGVEFIAEAIRLLDRDGAVQVQLIGDGQTADAVAQILAGAAPGACEWRRGWGDPRAVARAIAEADVCLGIFGDAEKAQRVWPLKNYAYMCVGRALITAETRQTRSMLRGGEAPPFVTVPPGDPRTLADAIVELAADPQQRSELAGRARAYYERHLASSGSLARLVELMKVHPVDSAR